MHKIGLRTLCAALACAGMSVCAMAEDIALIVTTRDSGKVIYALSQKPSVSFTATDVVIEAEDMQVSYPLSEHVQLTFGEMEGNAVKQVEGLTAVIACKAGQVDVSKATPGTAVSLYSADGKKLQTAKADSAGKASLPLKAKGVHIVKVGKMTMKITN